MESLASDFLFDFSDSFESIDKVLSMNVGE